MKNYGRDYYAKKNNKKKQIEKMKDYYKKNSDELRLKSKINHQVTKKCNEDYCKPNKNRIRLNVVKYLNLYNLKTILTLESKQFLFSKLIPDKKIFVFESNINNYNEMVKNKPNNVNLFFGDVSSFKELSQEVDFVYLDFCCSIDGARDVLVNLKEKIQQSKLFAVTLCPWCKMKNVGEYPFNLINEIQNITGINWKVLYGESYKDTIAMVTILFENPNKEFQRGEEGLGMSSPAIQQAETISKKL